MKAMTCPQCGALIKKISLKEEFADCDYCEAKILIEENRDKIVEIPEKPINFNLSLPISEEPEMANPVAVKVILFTVFAFVAIGVILAIAATFASRPKISPEKVQPRPVFSPISTPPVYYPSSTPLPEINYQVNVEWSGANDMEHFENPQIDSSKLPSRNYAELKKTVFKNRAAQVKITINTDGEVTQAEAISGHPILKEAAVEAAKKTLFNSRSKPTTRILTYYFRLIND